MRFLRREIWRCVPRRLCAGLALLAYLVASIGFPLPAASFTKALGQPFPCQHHHCGCQNAEQCWSSCCCYSPEEHLAWAEENKVAPPPQKESPPAAGWQTTRLRDRETEKCTKEPACSSCAAKEHEEAVREKSHSCADCKQSSAPPQSSGLRWISGISARCCQGQSTLWISTGAVLLPPPPPSWQPYACAPEWLAYCSSSLCSLSSIPPDPPPRLFNS
jgi:hypothetical protein